MREPNADRPRPFDLVELVVRVGAHPVGAHGTVIVEGVDHSIVDFAWDDSFRPKELRGIAISNSALRVVERRRGQSAPGARSSVDPSTNSPGSAGTD